MVKVEVKRRKVCTEKLGSFGFVKKDGSYHYVVNLVNGLMKMAIVISGEGTVRTEDMDAVIGSLLSGYPSSRFPMKGK